MFVVVALLTACGGGAPNVAQQVEPQPKPLPEGAVPMHYDRHLYLDVVVRDSIPARMIFDTGNTHLLFDSTFYADHFGRVRELRAMLSGAGNGVEQATIDASGWSYRVGAKSFDEPMAVVMNLRRIVGEGADGMLGMRFVKNERVRFNYAEGYLRILNDHEPIAAEYVRVPCKWLDQGVLRMVMPLAVTFKDGFTFEGNFLVDTGMPDALSLNRTTAERLAAHLTDVRRESYAVGGVGGARIDHLFTTERILLADKVIEGVEASWSENTVGAMSDTRYDGLIGNALLAHFDLIFDFAACTIYLRSVH